MAGDLVSPEARRGFLARIFSKSYERTGGRTVKTTVHRSENLDISVPTDRAEGARAAIERWFEGHGVAATVTVENKGDGKSRLHAKLGDSDAAKLDFRDEGIQSELQNVLTEALG